MIEEEMVTSPPKVNQLAVKLASNAGSSTSNNEPKQDVKPGDPKDIDVPGVTVDDASRVAFVFIEPDREGGFSNLTIQSSKLRLMLLHTLIIIYNNNSFSLFSIWHFFKVKTPC